MAGRGTVIVTGAGGGIGGAVVDEARRRGWTVVGTDLPGRGADVDLDVTDPDACHALVDEVTSRPDGLAGVVTAAGIAVGGPAELLATEDWRRVLDVNLWGTVTMVSAAYPLLMRAGSGHLVLIASLSGLLPSPLLAPYAATKWGVVGLARSLAVEARPHGVGVTAVCPGPVETPMLDGGGRFGTLTGGIDARRYLTDAAGPALPAAQVATAALDAIGTRKVVVAPGRARLFGRLTAVLPGLAARAVEQSMRKELRAAGAASPTTT